MKKLALLIAVGVLLTFGSLAFGGTTDIIQSPTNYFVPTDGQKYDSPYYRWNGEDWGWTHNAILGTITSATLNISAYDVDYDSWSPNYTGERDAIYAYDGGVKTFLGYLAGGNDKWSFTSFTLGSNFFDDINAGLQVWMEIDTNNDGWAVAGHVQNSLQFGLRSAM